MGGLTNGVEFSGGAKKSPKTETVDTAAANGVFKSDFTASDSTVSGSGMTSRFDAEITPVAGKVIEHANNVIKDYGLTGKATPVSIANSKTFRGVAIILQLGNVTYMQPLVFDERNPKTIQELIEDGRTNGKILFGPAILNASNAKYLASFDDISKDMVKLEPVVVISNNVKTDEAVDNLVKDMFKRIEAKPFNSVRSDIEKDKAKIIQSHFTVNGQSQRLQLTHKDQAVTMEDLIVGSSTSILDVDARVEPILGMKAISNNIGGQDKIYALRPIVYIKGYNKQGTFAKFNLEYALISIIAATVLTQDDKVVSALIPNKDKGLNIGSLNHLFGFHKESNGDAKPINFLKAGTDLQLMTQYITTAITGASLGIDLEYRSNATSFNIFGTLIDSDVTAEKKVEITNQLLAAYKNITGESYAGSLIEKAYAYPTGKVIYSNGTEISISEIDAIWLASRDKEDLATKWLQSDNNTNSIISKIEILNELASGSVDIEIKVESIGYKIILDKAFIDRLVEKSKFAIESECVLHLGREQRGFSGINIGISEGVSNAGFAPAGRGGSGFVVIG